MSKKTDEEPWADYLPVLFLLFFLGTAWRYNVFDEYISDSIVVEQSEEIEKYSEEMKEIELEKANADLGLNYIYCFNLFALKY